MNRTKAFTLAELLVAIATIAVLAALIAPVMVAARTSERQRTAAGNFRQLAAAMAQYRSDNDMTNLLAYVDDRKTFPTSDQGRTTWQYALYPYVNDLAAYSDPIAPTPYYCDWPSKPQVDPNGYCMGGWRKSFPGTGIALNWYMAPGQAGTDSSEFGRVGLDKSGAVIYSDPVLKNSDVPKPSERIILCQNRLNPLGGYSPLWQMTEYPGIKSVPAAVNQFYGIVRNSDNPHDYDSRGGLQFTDFAVYPWHGDKEMLAFYDGHVAAMRPTDTVKLNGLGDYAVNLWDLRSAAP